MQASEIRQMTRAEILSAIEGQRDELGKLRRAWYSGALANPNEITQARKDLARLLTVARELELALAAVQGEG